MTHKEALTLALDWFICYQDKSMSRNNAEALAEEVVEAIKEALAQPEQEHMLKVKVWRDENHDQKAEFRGWDKLPDGEHLFYTNSPQPKEREPVAWKQVMETAFWRMYGHGNSNNPVSAQCEVQALEMLCDGDFDDVTAWHPSKWELPPQRKPLTDKQLNIIGSRWHLNLLGADEKAELFAFARAIEAAHGIKEKP